MEVNVELQAQAPVSPGKNPGTRWVGDWLGPRAGLNVLEKRKISYPYRPARSVVTTPKTPLRLRHQLYVG
jgi:hypothetical protein